MRTALIALVAISVAACSAVPKQFHSILVPCQVPAIDKPVFAFDTLSVDADIFTKVKTLLSDRKARIGYEVKLEAANESCRR